MQRIKKHTTAKKSERKKDKEGRTKGKGCQEGRKSREQCIRNGYHSVPLFIVSLFYRFIILSTHPNSFIFSPSLPLFQPSSTLPPSSTHPPPVLFSINPSTFPLPFSLYPSIYPLFPLFFCIGLHLLLIYPLDPSIFALLLHHPLTSSPTRLLLEFWTNYSVLNVLINSIYACYSILLDVGPSSKTIILKWVFHINVAFGSHLSLLFSPAYPSLTLPYPLHPFAYISKPLLRGVFRGFSGSIHPNESVYVRQ